MFFLRSMHSQSAIPGHCIFKVDMDIALGTQPELLILDEPTAGMSPEETAVTIELINIDT